MRLSYTGIQSLLDLRRLVLSTSLKHLFNGIMRWSTCVPHSRPVVPASLFHDLDMLLGHSSPLALEDELVPVALADLDRGEDLDAPLADGSIAVPCEVPHLPSLYFPSLAISCSLSEAVNDMFEHGVAVDKDCWKEWPADFPAFDAGTLRTLAGAGILAIKDGDFGETLVAVNTSQLRWQPGFDVSGPRWLVNIRSLQVTTMHSLPFPSHEPSSTKAQSQHRHVIPWRCLNRGLK